MREDGITEQQAPPVLFNVLQEQGVQDEEKGIMTDLYRNPGTELVTVTSSHEFMSNHCFLYCDDCEQSTRHQITKNGIKTIFSCGCGNTWEREGSIA